MIATDVHGLAFIELQNRFPFSAAQVWGSVGARFRWFSLCFSMIFALGRSWAVLGGLGRSWVALGSSWGGLGVLLGHLGVLLGRLGSLLVCFWVA